MATQTEVITVTRSEDQESPDTTQEQQENTEKGGNWLRRRFSKNEKKSRKPPGNKWLQQQIPACRPVFTATHVSIGFTIIGVVFLAMGIAFTVVSSRLREYEFDYTNCESIDRPNGCEDYLRNISGLSNDERGNGRTPDCHCIVPITLPQSLRPPWNMYYGMRNYYQNHRRYLNSWDVDQLRGDVRRGPSSDCRPIINVRNGSETLPVVPCGLIANSWFNDSFDSITRVDSSASMTNITFIDRTNIAWNTDKTIRFRNPNGNPSLSEGELDGTVRPPNWPKDLSQIGGAFGNQSMSGGGLANESLIVWFRVSAFPLFRKLYGRAVINGGEPGRTELPAGQYAIRLTYNYPVAAFDGKKSIILAEVSVLGGRNLFLGIAYLVTGSLLIIAAVLLIIVHLFFSKWKTTDRDFLRRQY